MDTVSADRMVSVVIPVYNEKPNIESLYPEITTVMQSAAVPYEIIFVDDGSADTTGEYLRGLMAGDTAVRAITLLNRFGKSAALSAGFDAVRGGIVVTLDGDCQDDPRDITVFLEKIAGGADMVCGWRTRRKDTLHKIIASQCFNFITDIVTGNRFRDINSGMKAYRRNVLDNVTIYGELHRFIPVLVKAKGFQVAEVPVNNRPRRFGKSKFGLKRYMSGVLDLITVVFLTRFCKKPAHFFGPLALFLSTSGIVICSYIAYLRISSGTIHNRYPLLFLGILLIIVGVQLFSIGLLGEMLAYADKKREKNYVIKAGPPARP